MLEDWLNRNTQHRYLGAVMDLLHLWQDMVRVSDTPHPNEAVFQVYVELSTKWLANAKAELEKDLYEAATQAWGLFRSPLVLTNGLSMERMWEAMRPSVPLSMKGWEQYNSLLRLMERFDEHAREGGFLILGGWTSALTLDKWIWR